MLPRLFPSPTLARYMGSMFLWRSLAFLAGIVLILQTLDLLGESGDILAVPGNGEADLWRYVALRLPQLISLFLPFCVLLGTLLTFMTLNQNSEIVILKGAGLSPHQILAPLIVVGLLVSAVSFVFNETVLVRAQSEFDAWKKADYRKQPASSTSQGPVWVRAGEDLVQARQVIGEGSSVRLKDVTIFDRRDDRLVQVIHSAQAVQGPDGWRFDKVRLFDVAAGRQSSVPSVTLPIPMTPAQFTIRDINADHTAFWNLLPAIRSLEEAGRPTDALEAKLNHKVSGPLSATLMPLLGAVAAFGLARSGRLFIRAVIGLALGFAFFVADNFAMAMSDFGTLPAWAAAWGAFLLFMLIGEAVLFRTEE